MRLSTACFLLYIACFFLHTLYCKLYTVYYLLYIIYCRLYTVFCILYTVYGIMYTVPYIMHMVKCILRSLFMCSGRRRCCFKTPENTKYLRKIREQNIQPTLNIGSKVSWHEFHVDSDIMDCNKSSNLTWEVNSFFLLIWNCLFPFFWCLIGNFNKKNVSFFLDFF